MLNVISLNSTLSSNQKRKKEETKTNIVSLSAVNHSWREAY